MARISVDRAQVRLVINAALRQRYDVINLCGAT
jgi:hypothetical protein